MNHAENFLNLVNDAKKRIQEITVNELNEKLINKENFLLLDVRENDEWNHGHIPNALHLPRGILERDVETLIADKETVIVAYCGGGYRSALAADVLQKMSYTHVSSLAGGIKAWVDAHLEITTPSP